MSHLQTISKHSDTLYTPPDVTIDSVREPPKSFSSNARFRKDLMVLIRRFFLISLSLVFLVMTLLRFSKLKQLNKLQQRSFNTLSILATGMASLCLGSLLGYLGSMLRWPLLARTMYQMRDVDLILGMAPPTRSLRLIKRHIRERRISRTTVIVTVYLLTNILGRLSVAIFGLAFNLKDREGIHYPILRTNWTSAPWTSNYDPFADVPGALKGYEIAEDFLSAAWNGMREYGKGRAPNWAFNNSDPEIGDISPHLLPDLDVSNATLKIGTDTVEYSYQLKDFHENNIILANHTTHSAVNYSLIEVGEDKYWRWDNWNRTGPFSMQDFCHDSIIYDPSVKEADFGLEQLDWGEEYSNDVVARTLWVSNDSAAGGPNNSLAPIEYPQWVSFVGGLNASHLPSQTYILCGRIAWECRPTLSETIASKPPQPTQPRVFNSRSLYWMLGVHGGWYDYGMDTEVFIEPNSINNSPVQAAIDTLGPICHQSFTMPLNELVWNSYRLWVTGVVARLPILAIMHANTALPKIARSPHPNQTAGTAYTYKTLEIKWHRVILIVASITIGQFLASLTVLYYCNGIYTRDDSHLATAELLKTVINTPGFDGSKLMTGEELAVSLDHILEEGVSYGTRAGQDGGRPEVDLATGLDAKFPPFPPGQRF